MAWLTIRLVGWTLLERRDATIGQEVIRFERGHLCCVGHSSTAFDFIQVNWPSGGEGGIRTHGTVTRKTVFEFEDSRDGACRPVPKRVVWFANFEIAISSCTP
jgi:hypothetical protein